MVPTPRVPTGAISRTKASLEIIPDDRFIVFCGNQYEASSVKLTGRVRLHAPDAMSILKPRIRLEGKRKVSWWYHGSMSAGEIVDKRVIWAQDQKLSNIESAHKVNAGVIEWPFEFDLAPAMPESVEGLRETFIAYHLHASVSRSGWNAKDVTATEHIRLVRTLGPDEMEMTRSRVNSDIWANKVAYTVSIPSDTVVYGTSIEADFELSPIRKGIRFGKIEMRFLETVVKRIQSSEVPDLRSDRSTSEETEVARADMDFPEESKVLFENEDVDDPTMADEMYKFKAKLDLPKSLNQCRQDVDSHQINVSHRLKLSVNIHNPEGHVSQLVCRLPVRLFISPNLPVDEENQVHPGANGLSETQLNSTETAAVAPPQYGRHQLDQMYSDIDLSAFISRAGSMTGTPAGLMAQSRRGSHENVLSLNGLVDGSAASSHHGSAAPHLLHSRLADLQVSNAGDAVQTVGPSPLHTASGHVTPARRPADAASGTHSPEQHSYGSHLTSHSPPTATRSDAANAVSYFPPASSTSEGASIHQANYDLAGLSRVPSYGAALRAPSAAVTPFTEGPPSYVEATSRPPSPSAAASATTQPPARPSAAHVRGERVAEDSSGGGRSSGSSSSSSSRVSTPPPASSPSALPLQSQQRGLPSQPMFAGAAGSRMGVPAISEHRDAHVHLLHART